MRFETDYASHLLWWKSIYPISASADARSESKRLRTDSLKCVQRCNQQATSAQMLWKGLFLTHGMKTHSQHCLVLASVRKVLPTLQTLFKGCLTKEAQTHSKTPELHPQTMNSEISPSFWGKKREVVTSNIHSEGIRNCKLYILLLCI